MSMTLFYAELEALTCVHFLMLVKTDKHTKIQHVFVVMIHVHVSTVHCMSTFGTKIKYYTPTVNTIE